MEDNIKIEKWTLEDGRRAERHVREVGDERVVELHVEDERPLRLQQRVCEKTKPVIYERKIETLDKNGNIIDQKVESCDPRIQMQVVEHIATPTVTAQAKDDCDCHVTKEEMMDAIVAAIKATREPEPTLSGRLNSLGLADEIAGKPEDSSNKVLIAVIVAQVAILLYMYFVM